MRVIKKKKFFFFLSLHSGLGKLAVVFFFTKMALIMI